MYPREEAMLGRISNYLRDLSKGELNHVERMAAFANDWVCL